ncbi:uncharacterized protein LOC144116164 isoform X2 [Amblyomma americanum]
MNGEPQQVVDKTHGAPQTLHRCPRRSPHSSTHQSPHCSPQRVPRLAFLGSDGETMGPIRCCARCCMNRIAWIPLLTPGTAKICYYNAAQDCCPLHRCPRRSPHSSTHQSPHCSPQRVPRLAFLGSDGETMGPIRCCARCCMNRIAWIPLLTPGTARTLLFNKACWRPYGR